MKELATRLYQRQQNKFDVIMIVDGPRGNGKCLTKGSKVLMTDSSWKNVENIKIGDEVISPQKNGSYTFEKVTNLHNRFEKDIYEIREQTRNKKILYTCAGNHIVPTLRYERLRKNGKRPCKQILDKYDAKTLSTMRTRDSNYCSFSTTAIGYKNQKEAEIEPYCLGVWLGDGHFSSTLKYVENPKYGEWVLRPSHTKIQNGKVIEVKENISHRILPERLKKTVRGIGITCADEEIINEFSKFYPIMSIVSKKDNSAKNYRFSLNGQFANLLSEYGLEGKGSGDKFIPEKCLKSSIAYRLRLLAGIIDTDGYISKQNQISITTKSERLSKNIRDLVFSLGGYCSKRCFFGR
ncbi:MAG: hypothetical protein KKF39_05990 [Nanoarchaeota archaeon]|nr:hypothetical protein [Nanoarchaeota archaeon]